MTRLGRTYLTAMLPVLLLGYALGAFQLNADILWVDEMATVSAIGAENAPFTLAQIIASPLTSSDTSHSPLYYVVLAGWACLVGWTQVALRILSLLFGVMSIAFVYRFTANVFDRRVAWLAAVLFSSCAIINIYFHELRSYSLWILLSLVNGWQYWRLANGAKAGAASWICFIATTSALLYTHPVAPFALLGFGAHHLLLVVKDRRWLKVVFAWAAGIVVFLPYLPLVASGISAATESRSVQEEALSSFELMPMLGNVLTNGVDLLWLALLAAAGWALWRRRSRAFLRLLLIFTTMSLALLAFHALDPFVSTRRLRYFLVALTFAIPLAAQVLSSLPHWRLLAAVFLMLWLAGGYLAYRQAEQWKYAGHHSLLPAHPPLHRFADALRNRTRPHEVLLGFTQASFLNSGLHYGFSTVDYYAQTLLGVHGAFIYTKLQGSELRQEFSRRVGHFPYLTLVYQPDDQPENFDEVKTLLSEQYSPCEIVVDSDGIFARRYNYRTLDCARQYRAIEYDNGIKIIDRFADFDSENRSIRVVTGWDVADERQLDEYNVSIQIISADWQSVGQAPDRHLYDDVLTWYVVELPTADLPAGDYDIMVILYDRDTVKKVTGVDTTTGLDSDIHSVFSFAAGG